MQPMRQHFISTKTMSTFQIDFPGTPGQFTNKAGSAIKDKGGIFEGNDAGGTFHIKTAAGAVEGTYKVLTPGTTTPTPIAVTITKKPFLVSARLIEDAIKGFL